MKLVAIQLFRENESDPIDRFRQNLCLTRKGLTDTKGNKKGLLESRPFLDFDLSQNYC
jgi:hypothetical protein